MLGYTEATYEVYVLSHIRFFRIMFTVAHHCNTKHAQYSLACYRYFSSHYDLHVKAPYSGL